MFVATIILLSAVMPGVGLAGAQGPEGNWLSNPGFESGVWYFQDSVVEIQIPDGWWAYWREAPPAGLPLPSNCPRVDDVACYWARPEFKPVDGALYPSRVRSGRWAAGYFSWGRMHEAGLYQNVDDLPAGSLVRFSVWMQAWQCYDQAACQGGRRSDAPARMHLQVGIDPTGGWNPWSKAIVWSPSGEAFDEWKLFEVEAQMPANNSSVTVFTRSQARWDWPRVNNDLYLDDARLEVVGAESAATAQPGSILAAGFITHTVAQGETLLGIALHYGTSPERLAEINGLAGDFQLRPGDVLLAPGASAPRVTATPMQVTLQPVFTQPSETAGESHDQRAVSPAGAGSVELIGALVASALALACLAWGARRVNRYG